MSKENFIFTINMKSKSKKYNNIKLGIGIGKGIIAFILILLFVLLNYSKELEALLRINIQSDYLILLLFTLVIGMVSSIIFFPINYYSGFYLEHKYELSNQTFFKWMLENLKGTLVAGVIGIPLLLAFYFFLNLFGSIWWLPFAVLMFIVSVVLAQILPIIILPIFYKVSPIEDVELKKRIVKLASEVGMKVENVFSFNMSKNTKKANAAFTGLGKTKRIILGDTLLEGYSKEEIETVIAHEIGHYKHKHIVKNIFISTIFSFLTLFLIAFFYEFSLSWFNFSDITQIAALPILSLWGMLIGLIQTPISNWISRKYEYEADEYAVRSTRNPNAFKETLKKLSDQNLGDENPHPIVEWFFYSHPSIRNRILAINSISLG
ncbi:MAG: M48 family metallopeptidase [Melioribacteraceae bacterium]|nr:MAG: M48 family metallopeptidase [Melioribacteraceae bacterium]